jgi:hypothetical protein
MPHFGHCLTRTQRSQEVEDRPAALPPLGQLLTTPDVSSEASAKPALTGLIKSLKTSENWLNDERPPEGHPLADG